MHQRPFVIPNAGTIQKAITSVVFGSSSIWSGNWIWNFFERNKFLFESNKTANSLKISPNWTLSYAKTHVVNEQNSAMNWNALVPPKNWIFCWVTECNIHLLSCCPTVRWMFGRLFGFWEANTAILWELTGWPLEFSFHHFDVCSQTEWMKTTVKLECKWTVVAIVLLHLWQMLSDWKTNKWNFCLILSFTFCQCVIIQHFFDSSPVVAAVVPHISFSFFPLISSILARHVTEPTPPKIDI